MPFKDPQIAFGPAESARAFQAVFPLMRRLQYSLPDLQFATKAITQPRQISVPTRHGAVRTLIYSPAAADVAAQLAAGTKPPAHLITHGGGFIIRVPEQEDNVARYLASEVGCYVVLPDYDSAPKVRFPVAEEQNYDVFRWMRDHGDDYGWDAGRMTVGGASAGGKFALNVGQPVRAVHASAEGVAGAGSRRRHPASPGDRHRGDRGRSGFCRRCSSRSSARPWRQASWRSSSTSRRRRRGLAHSRRAESSPLRPGPAP